MGDAETGEGRRVARPKRADAERNLQTLLEASMKVFAVSGVEAPVREIAEAAGVGVGTLYRHFPTRADLIVAVFRREVDSCAEAAASFAREFPPDEALRLWMYRFVDFLAAKRGLAAALHSGDAAYEALPAYFDARLRPALDALISAAVAAGRIRAGVNPNELITAIASLCASARGDDYGAPRRMVALLCDGLCAGRPAPPA